MELQISRVIGVKPKVIIKNGCRNELVMRGGALARVSLSLSLCAAICGRLSQQVATGSDGMLSDGGAGHQRAAGAE